MASWSGTTLDGGDLVPEGSDIAAINRTARYLDVWFIGLDGSVRDAYWHDEQLEFFISVAQPVGSASAVGGIAALSRTSSIMEIWWIGPQGSIEAQVWGDDNEGWSYPTRRYQLAPPGSAALNSRLRVVSRYSTTKEVYWIGPAGSVEGAYWYLGGQWQRWRPAGPGSALPQSGLAVVSRASNVMEMWYISPQGAILGMWFSDGTGWHNYQLAPAGSALLSGGLDARSRASNTISVWWIGPGGSVQQGDWFEGINWKFFQLRPPGSAALNSRIGSVSRGACHIEMWFIGPNGNIHGSFWLADTSPWRFYDLGNPGQAKLWSAIGSLSQSMQEMEIWYVQSNDQMGTFTSNVASATFGSPITSAGAAALGGQANLVINASGMGRWSGQAYDSGIDGYNYNLLAMLAPIRGSLQDPQICCHSGHVGGAIPGSGSRADPWTESFANASIAANFNDFANGQWSMEIAYTSDIGSFAEGIFSAIVKWAAGAVVDASGICLVVIGIEVYSLLTAGDVIMWARLAHGVLWLAGPGNTLIALAADGLAEIGSRERAITTDEYNWANTEVFDGELPPIDTIVITDTGRSNGRWFTFPRFDGKITINVGASYLNPMSFAGGQNFIHELTHAWQIRHTDLPLILYAKALVAAIQGDHAYDYPAAGQPWSGFGLEQQAMIVQDWWMGNKDSKNSSINQTGKAKDTKSPYYRYIIQNIEVGQL